MTRVLICGYESEEFEDESINDPVNDPADAPVDAPVDDPTDDPVDDPADDPVDDPTDDPVDDPADDPVDDPADDPVDDPADDPVDDPADDPVDDPSDDPVDDPADDPVDDPADDPVDDPADNPEDDPVDDSADNPVDDSADDPVDEPADNSVDESVEVVMEVPVVASQTMPSEAPATASVENPVAIPTAVPLDDSIDGTLQQEPIKHVHTEECYEITYQCGLEEHAHKISCFSDESADLEDKSIWEATLPELTGQVSEDVVLVAQSQLGYTESTLNFELAEDEETQNGITRYGQWYGNPYGLWSNMFTSFCLHYAGVTDVPLNSGAETMRLDWEELGLYWENGRYEPVSGDIVFLDKNQNGTAESTAIVVNYFDFVLTVIEGDVDNAVVQQEYRIDDPKIMGYGITSRAKGAMVMAADLEAAPSIGKTVAYDENLINSNTSFILYTIGANGRYFAIDGNGAAVEIRIDDDGTIYSDVSELNMLYWKFATYRTQFEGKPTYSIQNLATEKYLHPYRDDSTTYGVMNATGWGTALYEDSGAIKFRGANQPYYVQLTGASFGIVEGLDNGSAFYFGKAPSTISLWLDGTNGGIMSYLGSDDTKYTIYSDVETELPNSWKSPTKYGYTLAGWVDIKTGDYYVPGAKAVFTEDTVLYADWVATTYDIGRYNSQVADTISTNDFITTRMFDYSSLINLNSAKVNVNISDDDHSESWSHVQDGQVTYKDHDTLNFSFNDHDGSGSITNLNSLNAANKYTGGTGVHSGIYTYELGKALFATDNLFNPETGEGIVGKHYLGKGDHLFQINTDPTSEFYGYYYYDAKYNAASYNQSDQRFYVYDYLARTSDSNRNGGDGQYSDFLPLNSSYANTNGQTIKTYNYNGEDGEYSGVSHYEYDARYDSNGSASNQVKANLWFGMSVEIQFGLSETPGEKIDGKFGNKDIYGNDMHFKFTGDDDVWVLLDGKPVLNGRVILDLGGIHQASDGDINFSTGEIHVNGSSVGQLTNVEPGEHTLTILYLERGSSMSNCAIYFNLAPRFSLTLQKEDVLTQEKLNGATFEFYHDQACTVPCQLATSRQAYLNKQYTNSFTIANGQAYIWGLNPSTTYYIREVSPPQSGTNAPAYDASDGVIKLTLDKNGLNSYSATILEAVDENNNKIPITHGFTVHGFRVDDEKQAAYITVTNAQNWVTETTSVYVEKKWNDHENHTHDAVTAYLNVTDPDGKVRRIREITLSEENDWKYEWTNLPKYTLSSDGVTESDVPVQYSVSEAYVPGYVGQVTKLESGTYKEEAWQESTTFTNGQTYILKTASGCISAVAADKNTLCFVSEAEAKNSDLALWKATVSNEKVKLTNQEGQILTYISSGGKRYFSVTKNSGNQALTASKDTPLTLAYSSYYMCGLNRNSYADAKNRSSDALKITPILKYEKSTTINLSGYGYTITNTPLSSETSLKVNKMWESPNHDSSLYEKEEITVRLLANGVDTGRTENISLKTDWTATFMGLPYMDDAGNPIEYTVVESAGNSDWIPVYGLVDASGDAIPTYETTITNTYRWTGAVELPATGGIGIPILTFGGLVLISAPFVYGFSMRRKYERRRHK